MAVVARIAEVLGTIVALAYLLRSVVSWIRLRRQHNAGRWLLMALVCASVPVEAATLYVNNSGSPSCSDATVKASNSAGSPWCTIGRAAWGNAVRASANASEAAAAGDTVLITAGTYSQAGQTSRHNSAFNPVNSGTSGNYIAFQASGTVTLQLTGGTTGATVGCDGVNYIKWIGFTINEQNAPPVADTGPVVGNNTIGCWFERLTVIGYQYGHNRGDNHVGIRFDACDSCYAGNNTISGIYTCISAGTCNGDTPVNYTNGAGMQMYESDDVIIEHNDISDSGSGIFIKGPELVRSMRTIIRYNKIHGTGSGILMGASEDAHVYQNLVYGTTTADAIRIWELVDSTALPLNCAIYNNTIVGNIYGFIISSTNHTTNTFQNNLIATTSDTAVYSGSRTVPGDITMDRNHYYSYATFSALSGTSRTLAQWRTAFSDDLNSVDSDPIFANAAGSDYRLCTGSGVPHASCSGASPALTTGRAYNNICGTTGATIPAGAYCTGSETIGIESTPNVLAFFLMNWLWPVATGLGMIVHLSALIVTLWCARVRVLAAARVVALHAVTTYWAWRYRIAVARWQRQAPTMIGSIEPTVLTLQPYGEKDTIWR